MCGCSLQGGCAGRRGRGEGRAAQARGHGGLGWGGWWLRDKRKNTGREILREALWPSHSASSPLSAAAPAPSRPTFFTLEDASAWRVPPCGRPRPAEPTCCDGRREQMHGLQRSRGEKGTAILARAHRPSPRRAFIVFLGSYIKEGFLIYYLEYYCTF